MKVRLRVNFRGHTVEGHGLTDDRTSGHPVGGLVMFATQRSAVVTDLPDYVLPEGTRYLR